MKLLVLGGTSFVGRHMVLAARAAGLDVTLFNRGQTNPGLFADLEHLVGDRTADLSALRGREWDAVLDVNGYLPRVVGATLEALAGSYGHYTYISTLSVYGDTGSNPPDESYPLAALQEPTEVITEHSYGPLKAACEGLVREHAGRRALIARPGLVVGPHDHTDRFVRWIRRGAEGGEILAPGDPDRQVTFIDGRDLGDWVIRLIVAEDNGTYNGIGPAGATSYREMLETCVAATGGAGHLTWVAEEFLLANGVEPWSDFPLWMPAGDNGMLAAPNAAAIAAGLTFRPLADTVLAALRWDQARADRRTAGMPVERERELLALWHAQQGQQEAPKENRS